VRGAGASVVTAKRGAARYRRPRQRPLPWPAAPLALSTWYRCRST